MLQALPWLPPTNTSISKIQSLSPAFWSMIFTNVLKASFQEDLQVIYTPSQPQATQCLMHKTWDHFTLIFTAILSAIFSLCIFFEMIKMDSVQRSSNTCKNYLLKIYSQHVNFLNAIYSKTSNCNLVVQVTPLWNPQAFSRNLMSNFVRTLKTSIIVFSTKAKRPF